MIENTLGSLMALMGFAWVGTQVLKGLPLLNKVPQQMLVLLVGELATVAFWQADLVSLDGADKSTGWGWIVALLYGLFAIGTAMQAHDTGSNPKKLVKKIEGGKVLD